jgi:hypothetical protein
MKDMRRQYPQPPEELSPAGHIENIDKINADPRGLDEWNAMLHTFFVTAWPTETAQNS